MKPLKIKFYLPFIFALAIGIAGTSCEGPIGPQGPQGEQGPPGPVGPAGSDGSLIHAGQGMPDETTGNSGDFYLDLATGNLYGPKMEEGWGAPLNLTGDDGPEGPQGPQGPEGPQGPAGEDGEDGQDGQNGQDGEDGKDGQDGEDGKDGKDGSRIFAGDGPPSNSLGKKGDYYLDRDNYDLYGPKTGSGWGTPINLQGPKGDKGTANVIYSKWLDIEWTGADEADYKRMDIIEPAITEEFLKKGTVLMYLHIMRSESDRSVHALPFATSAGLTLAFFMRPEGFTSPLPGTFPHEAGLSFYVQYGGSGLVSYNSFVQVRYILIPDGIPAKVPPRVLERLHSGS